MVMKDNDKYFFFLRIKQKMNLSLFKHHIIIVTSIIVLFTCLSCNPSNNKIIELYVSVKGSDSASGSL